MTVKDRKTHSYENHVATEVTEPTSAEPKDGTVPEESRPVAYVCTVEEGRTIQCRRGRLTAGMRVEPEYVGGEIVLERLIQEGHVKRNPVPQER